MSVFTATSHAPLAPVTTSTAMPQAAPFCRQTDVGMRPPARPGQSGLVPPADCVPSPPRIVWHPASAAAAASVRHSFDIVFIIVPSCVLWCWMHRCACGAVGDARGRHARRPSCMDSRTTRSRWKANIRLCTTACMRRVRRRARRRDRPAVALAPQPRGPSASSISANVCASSLICSGTPSWRAICEDGEDAADARRRCRDPLSATSS